ncbi:hypothetical protein ACFX2I_000406 [Malus domestica]|uniref:uncharacterized protein n=1 Tax=Malus domestica TaxID=3750 RepID=UPI000498D4AF|nr:uncharacterized protein LOC103437572 [Malus domestica]XP_050154134.1 uncharacterized protein LOC126628473 [Malus sylvestris]
MAGWISNNTKSNPKAVDGNEMFLGLTAVSHKTAGLHLIQNCDLPPPSKLFTGSGQTVVSSMKGVCRVNSDRDNDDHTDDQCDTDGNQIDGENEKLELLKALRLSQTRAREAENKSERLEKEKDRLSNALLVEAKELFAYKQWVRLLELQVSRLQSHWAEEDNNKASCGCGRSKGDDDGDGITWVVALALCFGIAGVGFAFGCRFLY